MSTFYPHTRAKEAARQRRTSTSGSLSQGTSRQMLLLRGLPFPGDGGGLRDWRRFSSGFSTATGDKSGAVPSRGIWPVPRGMPLLTPLSMTILEGRARDTALSRGQGCDALGQQLATRDPRGSCHKSPLGLHGPAAPSHLHRCSLHTAHPNHKPHKLPHMATSSTVPRDPIHDGHMGENATASGPALSLFPGDTSS